MEGGRKALGGSRIDMKKAVAFVRFLKELESERPPTDDPQPSSSSVLTGQQNDQHSQTGMFHLWVN